MSVQVCLGLMGWGLMVGDAYGADIYIVDTVERDATIQLGQSFEKTCPSCGAVKYRQMNGNLRAARRIANELVEEEKNGRLSLVITLGRPATQIITRALQNTPILYTFVGQKVEAFESRPGIVGLPTDASLSAQVNLLRRMLPSIKNAGVIVGSENPNIQAQTDQVGQMNVNLYKIDSANQLPATLRLAVQQNEALIFLRDPLVVNNDSIKFLMTHTLENRRHIIGYSKSLVDMGFTAALVPKPEAFGRLLGKSAEVYFVSGSFEKIRSEDTDYIVHVNQRAVDQLAQGKKSVAGISAGLLP